MVQKKYEDVVVAVDDFFFWTNTLKVSTLAHLQELDGKMADIISENSMMSNWMTGLLELESATLQR